MTCKVATCSLHICRSFVMSLMPPQIFPISLISFSTVHRQLFLGRRFHSRVQCRAVYPTSTTSTTICLLSRNGGSQQFWLHTFYLSVLHCRWIMLALWQNYFQSKSAHLQETVVKVMHEYQRTDSNGEIVSLISYHNLFHYSSMKKNVRRPFR